MVAVCVGAGFPRVCGDVPAGLPGGAVLPTFSPRMRGCSVQDNLHSATDEVFPAYAGMFLL